MNSKIWDARAELSKAMKEKMPDYIVEWWDFKVQYEQFNVQREQHKKQLYAEIAAAKMKQHNLR